LLEESILIVTASGKKLEIGELLSGENRHSKNTMTWVPDLTLRIQVN
jgi:hypothetical protein